MEENYRKKLDERDRRRENRRRQVMKQKMILGGIVAVLLFIVVIFAVKGLGKKEEPDTKEAQKKTEKKKEPETVSLTLSAAGDCTLGTDENFAYESGFVGRYEQEQNPAYFFEKVKPIFEKDDLTVVNMEGTLTEASVRAEKTYAFKGDPSYTKILTEGSVEAANLANNHTLDYGEQSYTDTIDNLDKAGITSFGKERTAIIDVKGIKVGLLGTYELDQHMDCEEEMIKNIQQLKKDGAQLIVASFHWGIERENVPNDTQIALAHSAVDHGADLVLGHHPHVLQGIEEYKGKNIVYSLANFCFGGNSSPSDMDTMIFQQTFTFTDGKLKEDNETNIIPCKISSSYAEGYNDYQPTPVEGEEKEAILSRVQEYSQAIKELTGNDTKTDTQEKNQGESVSEE